MRKLFPFTTRKTRKPTMNPVPNPNPQPNPRPNTLPQPQPDPENDHRTAEMFDRAERVLKAMQTPQAIRELPCFNGDAVKLHSFIKSVENLTPFITAMEGTPFFDVWIQSIRAKITGEADRVLEIYGTPANWEEIKNNLIAYYNDKRDPVTLTRELFQLQQTRTIEDFFGKVQNLLSLLINHTNINTVEINLKADRTSTHQENALQVFLAGLREPIGGNVRARQPRTLKQGFDAAIEERNFLSRAGLNAQRTFNFQSPAYPPKPAYQPTPTRDTFVPRQFSIPRLPIPNRNMFAPRLYPKPQPRPTPMDIDPSIRTQRVNYMNRSPQIQTPRTNNNYFIPNVPRAPFHPPQRQNFNQNGPPRFHVEELRNVEQLDFDENPEYYTNYYNDYESCYAYENPSNYYTENQIPEAELHEETSSNSNNSEETASPDNLNFQIVSEGENLT